MKAFRLREDLTQKELGQLLAVTQNAITQYEMGARMPRLNIAKRFLDLAKQRGYLCTLEDLYSTLGECQ